MSNLIGCKVLVYPPTFEYGDGIPYEAIVKTVEILSDGTHKITEVIPIDEKGKIRKVADRTVTFVSSPLGKQLFDRLSRLFKRKERKNQAPRF